jgi:hypothetical protein
VSDLYTAARDHIEARDRLEAISPMVSEAEFNKAIALVQETLLRLRRAVEMGRS